MSADYGRYRMENGALPNRNPKTGIRYGIISAHHVADWAVGEFEPVYCDHSTEPCDCPEEAEPRWIVETPEESLELTENNEIWVYRSPFTALGSHCSPCAPGAVYLGGLSSDVRAYALGPDWFDDGFSPMPYDVERVDMEIRYEAFNEVRRIGDSLEPGQ